MFIESDPQEVKTLASIVEFLAPRMIVEAGGAMPVILADLLDTPPSTSPRR